MGYELRYERYVVQIYVFPLLFYFVPRLFWSVLCVCPCDCILQKDRSEGEEKKPKKRLLCKWICLREGGCDDRGSLRLEGEGEMT